MCQLNVRIAVNSVEQNFKRRYNLAVIALNEVIYVPTRAQLHFLLNFEPNGEIIQKRYLSLKKSLQNRITN